MIVQRPFIWELFVAVLISNREKDFALRTICNHLAVLSKSMMQRGEEEYLSQIVPVIPISKAPSSKEELIVNDELRSFMINTGVNDTKEGNSQRQQVLKSLNKILCDWAISVGTAKNLPADEIDNGGGIQLLLFGSTKLEVNSVDSDIDTLCVAPSFITREEFFTLFCEHLSKINEVEALLSIPDAYTPVLKFVFESHSVDMVFASLQLKKLPLPIDLLDLNCLHGLDEQSVRSLNGVRVAEWICKIVPNLFSYQTALRVIKYWAKQRGLYSSILGFLGGVNFAILVAQISRLYPNACPFVLVQKFFAVYSSWQWPTPVMLRDYEDLRYPDSDGRYLPVWNCLLNYRDSLHLMPIITPTYPAMNSAYNVTRPQFRAFQMEIIRAHMILQSHGVQKDFPWPQLFASSTEEFFKSYPRYIQVRGDLLLFIGVCFSLLMDALGTLD